MNNIPDCASCWYPNLYYPHTLNQMICRKELFEMDQDHKSYYEDGRKYEPRRVISDWDLNFNLGNAVKYISRAGRKNPQTKKEDLGKAIQYIKYELEDIENENS